MKKLNLLNRGTIIMLRLSLLYSQCCGVAIFHYESKSRTFRQSRQLFVCVLAILLVHLSSVYQSKYWLRFEKRNNLHVLEVFIVIAVRVHLLWYNRRCIRLFNEMFAMLQQLTLLARRPNIVQWPHLLLLLCPLFLLLWSLHSVHSVPADAAFSKAWHVLFLWILTALQFPYLLQVTINVCLFIVLIACYDELHLCTRRISQDVLTLRQNQFLDGGQLAVLIAKLRGILIELIALRLRVWRLNVQLLKHYRFYWLCAIFHWLPPVLSNIQMANLTLWQQLIGVLNIAFYWLIVNILVWKAQLSRSFWNLQLKNVHSDFDRTIDELLHLEILERGKVSIYGIKLDMRFLLKVSLNCILYLSLYARGH